MISYDSGAGRATPPKCGGAHTARVATSWLCKPQVPQAWSPAFVLTILPMVTCSKFKEPTQQRQYKDF